MKQYYQSSVRIAGIRRLRSAIAQARQNSQEILNNFIHSMQDLNSVLPTLEQTSQKTLLSPFTWTNLTLPPLVKSQKEISISKKNNQQNALATISQTVAKQKRQNKTSKINHSVNIQHNSKSIDLKSNVQSEPSKILNKAKRYGAKDLKHQEALNKTIEVKARRQSVQVRLEAPISTSQPCKRIKFLDQKSNMEQYLKMNLTKAGWKSEYTQKDANLLWSNMDRPTDYNQLAKGQFYNHINGSHHLTSKNYLHEQLKSHNYHFYPSSFLVPTQYEEFMRSNNHLAIMSMLRVVGSQIISFLEKQKMNGEWQKDKIWLRQILQSSILQRANDQTNLLVKLCMQLEIVRIENGYCSYFQAFQGYQKVNIKPKNNLFQKLFVQASNYLSNNPSDFVAFDYSHIDYRLLILLLHYYKLFQLNSPAFEFSLHLWIIKPIASSRGAGISIIRSNPEFCLLEGNQWNQFKNIRKYQNKIIQTYIPNPYLLRTPKLFTGRKFDIRQWVLMVSQQNEVTVYRYHTAYCRFAPLPFTTSKLNREIHLTNYSIFKDQQGQLPSVMMLEQLFSFSKEDLRSKYLQQSTHIIKEVISNCNKLQYKQGCFELLGFDFLLDSSGKLFLLEINLNPACASERNQKLKKQSDIMAQSMLELVTQRKSSDRWVQVLGPQYTFDQDDSNLADLSGFEVKPFYKYRLEDEESLIALVRYRNNILMHTGALIKRYFSRLFLCKLGKLQHCIEEQTIKEKKNDELKQQNGSQKQSSRGEIRFIEQKSVSNT